MPLFRPKIIAPIPDEDIIRPEKRSLFDRLFKSGDKKPLSPIPNPAIPSPTPTIDPFIEKGWEKTGENKYAWPKQEEPTTTPVPNPSISAKPRGADALTLVDNELYQDVFDAVDKAAKEYNVPGDLLLDIAFAESSLDTNSKPYWFKMENGEMIKSETKPKEPGWSYTTSRGLFQFNDGTWNDMKRWAGLPDDADRLDAETSAKAAAWAISNGYLGKWDASKHKWGELYEDDEIEDYYL